MANLSEQYKCLFVRIPKTGSTAVLQQLGDGRNFGHYTGTHIRSLLGDGWGNYFKFAFVRNPWDRIVSMWHYMRSTNRIHQDFTFSIFVKSHAFDLFWRDSEIRQIDYLREPLDFIGRYETLQQDFDVVCKCVGMPLRALSHSGTSRPKRDFYQQYYTKELQDVVGNFFREEIERFKYAYAPTGIKSPPNQ